MKIYFIRHGETDWNRARRLQGRSDLPLNAAGIARAVEARDRLAARGLRFDRILSSPLTRALQTARIICGDGAVIGTDDRLLEMDYGPWEGMSLDAPAPELLGFFRDFAHAPAPAGMESLEQVKARLRDLLQDLRGIEAENVLVSTHAIALKGALEVLTPDAGGGWWSRYIGTCAVFVTELKDGQYTVPREFLAQSREPWV